METLQWPIRVEKDGRLARTDAVSTLMAVVWAMACTPRAGRRHAPWFGVEEAFEAVNPRLEEHPAVADALNEALVALGVDWMKVHSVRLLGGAAPGERRFALAFTTPGGVAHRELTL
ncbi:MAG TPA: hypothetical protein VFQ39_17820 [Longimicrobium sp.]|nr:hypothetical protein [Longimicrobium sp.]